MIVCVCVRGCISERHEGMVIRMLWMCTPMNDIYSEFKSHFTGSPSFLVTLPASLLPSLHPPATHTLLLPVHLLSTPHCLIPVLPTSTLPPPIPLLSSLPHPSPPCSPPSVPLSSLPPPCLPLSPLSPSVSSDEPTSDLPSR